MSIRSNRRGRRHPVVPSVPKRGAPGSHAPEAPPRSLLDQLPEADARFQDPPAPAVVKWALDRFGPGLVLAASFQDVVLIDLAVAIDPAVEVVFLDTEAHFEETLRFVEDVRARYGLNLTVTHPGRDAAGVRCGSTGCCELRKVAPLRRVLEGRAAWVTGLRRCDAATRAEAPIVSWDDAFGLVKVNPLATWTDDDVDGYLKDHDLPVHPLASKGYLSIGCAPTTRPVREGEDHRAGRWSGTDKTECGLHA